MKNTRNHNYEYFLSGVQKGITEIAQILNIPRSTLKKRIGNDRIYTAIINGYTFKAVRINKNDK